MPRVGDDDGLELQGQGNSRRRLLGDKTASWKKARDRAEADLKAAKDQAVKDVRGAAGVGGGEEAEAEGGSA